MSGNSRLEKATIFQRGAELTRTMEIQVSPGKNEATFGGLPQDIRPESVTASLSGGGELLNVSHRINHMEKPEAAAKIKELSTRLEETVDRQKRNAAELTVLNSEEQFLRSNQQVGGRRGFKLADLQNVAEYFRARLTEIAEARIAAEREQKDLQEEYNRLAKELGACQGSGTEATSEILVELSATAAGTVQVSVSYYTLSARWTPTYEIRVEDTDSPARLACKGKIVQTTGEDWENVSLILSSGTPSTGGVQPELAPWYLDFDAPVAAAPGIRPELVDFAPMEEMAVAAAAPMRQKMARKTAPRPRQAQTSLEFILPSPLSIPSRDEEYTVEILHHQLPALYQHYCVRKLDRDVYLLAKIKGWEKLSLLEGKVGIFLGNTYVGSTWLDPRKAEEEMELSLGRDSGVIVTRVKGRDFAGTTLLGKNNKVSRQWVLTVRNTRQKPIDIKLLDQIPVPVNNQISVEALEFSGGSKDAETGELCWELHLEAGETAQKTVKYEVTYPKGKSLTLE